MPICPNSETCRDDYQCKTWPNKKDCPHRLAEATASRQGSPSKSSDLLNRKAGNNTFAEEIEESHPWRLNTGAAYRADALAMKLVGERHEKRELVDLVRWLILDRAETANKTV